MIRVPKQALEDLEAGFLHVLFAANRVAEEIETGAEPKSLAGALQQEVSRAVTTITNWHEAKRVSNAVQAGNESGL
jgi:hypothetical protein